jgi:hypothetical protein
LARRKRSTQSRDRVSTYPARGRSYQTKYTLTKPKGTSLVHRLACASALHLLEVWAQRSHAELCDHVLRFNSSGLTEKERDRVQRAARALEISRLEMRKVKLDIWGLKDAP